MLSERILMGDREAIASLYDESLPRVHAYCELVCPPERVQDAVRACFLDFLARLELVGVSDAGLTSLLLKATRSAAASRTVVAAPASQGPASEVPSAGAVCWSMCELFAAQANGELPSENGLVEHLQHCPVCQLTRSRLSEAEHAFTQPPEDEAAQDVAGASAAAEAKAELLAIVADRT